MKKDITFKQFFKKIKLINTFSIIIISLIIGFIVRMYIFELVKVDGLSMFPTYNNEQHLGVLKTFQNIKQGDIVIFKSHDIYENIYVKRIIGLPNDHIVIKNNEVYINDIKLKEKYLPPYVNTNGEIDIIIPNNEYFVMGDNRSQSKDSRLIGTIKKDDIMGKVIFEMF